MCARASICIIKHRRFRAIIKCIVLLQRIKDNNSKIESVYMIRAMLCNGQLSTWCDVCAI